MLCQNVKQPKMNRPTIYIIESTCSIKHPSSAFNRTYIRHKPPNGVQLLPKSQDKVKLGLI
jgi:hypothetical protein